MVPYNICDPIHLVKGLSDVQGTAERASYRTRASAWACTPLRPSRSNSAICSQLEIEELAESVPSHPLIREIDVAADRSHAERRMRLLRPGNWLSHRVMLIGALEESSMRDLLWIILSLDWAEKNPTRHICSSRVVLAFADRHRRD